MYDLVIVDDELYILDQLGDAFSWESMGFKLCGLFTNSHDALEYIRSQPVDVLLTDIQLGSDTGLDLALEARRLKPELEMVILSAYSYFEYARGALRLNVHDYLLKPVTFSSVSSCFEGLRRKIDERRGLGNAKAAPENGAEDNYRIAMVKQHVDKHLGDDVTLEGTAAFISMNPAYFSRFFKQHTGYLFSDYLAERRMEKAIELLRDPSLKVFEICYMVGYFSKKNFYKRFRQHTGRTPAEYRNDVLKIQDDGDEA